MVPRATLIAVLIGVEVAIVVGMAGAVRGSSPSRWFGLSGADAGAASGSQAWTFAAGTSPVVVVDIGHADLTFDARPGAEIAVTVMPGLQIHSSGPISARKDGGTIRITAANRDDDSSMYADDRNVHVIVPPATRVIVERAGDIEASGLRAGASFDSPNGGITVRDFHGDLTASTSNGHVDISDADCPTLNASSSNGRLVLRRVNAARIEASSSNGRVEATALDVRDGSVSSSNGRVSLSFAPDADTTVTAGASNGSVRVFGLSATAPGVIPGAGDDEDDDDSPPRTVRIGGGSGRLDVHASNGNIDLTRES